MNWDFTNDSHIEVIDSVTIQGYRFSDGWARDQHVYFRTRFSKPFTAVQMDTTAILKDGKRMGTATIARFDFDTQKGEQILVNTALSGVSMEGAAQNLAAEVPEDNFDKYREAARDNWNRQLSKIAVKGDHKDDWVNFYTALYHTMLAPTIIAMSTVRITVRTKDSSHRRMGKLQYFLFMGYIPRRTSSIYLYRTRTYQRYGSIISGFLRTERTPAGLEFLR